MKVLLIHGWHPIEGGAEGYAVAVRQGLRDAGHEVRLLVSSAGSAANGTADYVAYGTTRRSEQAFLQIANPWAVSVVRRALREFRPDVAFVGVFADFLSPAIFESLGRVPTVLWVVDYKVVCPNSRKLLPDGSICTDRHGTICRTRGCTGLLHWLRDRPRYALIQRALSRVERVVVCGRHIQGVLAAEGVDALHLHWPVPPVPLSYVRAPAARPTFLYVGRLSREKGVAVLLRSFARVLPRFPDAVLRVAGEGPDEGALRATAREEGLGDRVTFLGWNTSEALEHEFAMAWTLVAPSVWAEPLGVNAIEAIVRGVPVIASETGGLAETVRPGETGLIVPNGDVEALARAMLDIAGGAVFPDHTVSEGARVEISSRHDVRRHVTELQGILRQAVAARETSIPRPA